MTREEKELLDKLKNRCDSLGIDINIVGESDLLLIYNGTTFYMEYYIYNNKLEVPLSIVSMNIKGKEYGYETYNFVDIDYTDSYDTVDNAVEEITDIVVNSNNRRKALKIINSFESFIEDNSVGGEVCISSHKDSFIEGTEWADTNPKSPWISVDDDLPCNHEELITTDGYYEKETVDVITISKSGIIDTNYMVLYNNGIWRWKYDIVPCYWMPISKIPK